MQPLDPIAHAMRKAQRAAQGGRVILTLSERGEFQAAVYLPWAMVHDATIERLGIRFKGGRSFTMEELELERDMTARTPVKISGAMATPVGALDDLLALIVAARR